MVGLHPDTLILRDIEKCPLVDEAAEDVTTMKYDSRCEICPNRSVVHVFRCNCPKKYIAPGDFVVMPASLLAAAQMVSEAFAQLAVTVPELQKSQQPKEDPTTRSDRALVASAMRMLANEWRSKYPQNRHANEWAAALEARAGAITVGLVEP